MNGVWTYTLDDTNSAVQGLSAGQTLHDQFNVATADGTTKLMDITINGADDTATITTTSVTTSETNLPSFNFFLVGARSRSSTSTPTMPQRRILMWRIPAA